MLYENAPIRAKSITIKTVLRDRRVIAKLYGEAGTATAGLRAQETLSRLAESPLTMWSKLYPGGASSALTPMEITMHPDFARHDPLRRLNWRGIRAMKLFQNKERPAAYDEKIVRRYLSFLKAYHAAAALAQAEDGDPSADDFATMLNLRDRYPHLWHAHHVHLSAENEERAILEARLLAREDDESIAAKSSMTPMTVNLYEALFFNVRDRLDASDSIYLAALRFRGERGPDGQPSAHELHQAIKAFAYNGGPLILEDIVSTLSWARSIGGTDDRAFSIEQFQHWVRVVSALAAYMDRWRVGNVTGLIRLVLRGKEMGEKLDAKEEERLRKLEAGAAKMVEIMFPNGIPADLLTEKSSEFDFFTQDG